MRTLKWILAGLAVGAAFTAVREALSRRTAPPAPDREPAGRREPLLGYDGMDQETLLEWLDDAALDAETLADIVRYERANRRREPVIDAVEALLG